MSANNLAHQNIRNLVNELDFQLANILGFCMALRLIAAAYELETSDPSNVAFWAVLDGAESAAKAAGEHAATIFSEAAQ
ncbi:hypothetical protein KL867_17665 [Ruegeria litorea]|uniref:Uncharacterized protein n=1 Tax=Falsiruegeria litorea TaxID=1280831 RepID=A0ABS5WYJ7_9RHOB|nr:hypothetical protein [Falsiruegeria litorea]MBT3142900.1 hypothetical protein [Falsiruegeria litorea]